MKKCFTMLLSVGLAGICAIGIAACGGGSSVKNIVSDIVAQEEWEAAFAEENFENFKLELLVILHKNGWEVRQCNVNILSFAKTKKYIKRRNILVELTMVPSFTGRA